MAEQPVAGVGEPGRHLVERRRGDDQDAEEGEQRQQRHHDELRAEQVEQQARRRRTRPHRRRCAGRWCRRARAAGCRPRCGRCRGRRRTARTSRSPGGRPGRCARGRASCASRRSSSASGTRKPTLPTEPSTTVRVASMTEPGSCHQTAAATTTASPKRNSPTPSRRCSGSRSRAVWPMLRATAPTPCAIASQTAATPRNERAEGARDRTRAVAYGARRRTLRCRPLRGGSLGAHLAPRARALGGRLALRTGTPGSGARAASASAARGARRPGGGRALAPRPRRGRRTGRHAHHPRRTSLQSHGPHGRAVRRRRASGSDVGGRASRAAELAKSRPACRDLVAEKHPRSRHRRWRAPHRCLDTRCHAFASSGVALLDPSADAAASFLGVGWPQASMTTGMIIGRRRCLPLTQRPTTRRTVCWSW